MTIKCSIACVMVLVMTAVLWGQCANCPMLRAQPQQSEHGCCPGGKSTPPADDHCTEQERKLELYKQSDFAKIVPAFGNAETVVEPAVTREFETRFVPPKIALSALYVLNSNLRI